MLHRISPILLLPLIAAACTGTSEKSPEKGSLPAEQPKSTTGAAKPAQPAPTPASPSAASTTKTSTPADAAKSSSSADKSIAASDAAKTGDGSLLALKVSSLDGKPVDLSSYKGKVALVVNVASQCGYTPQYAGLEALYKELEPKGFVILGFPSNDFGGQEPGSPDEIRTFCTENYGVTFPLFAKIQTKAGPDQSPVYSYLNGATGKLPTWNFCKYLIGKDGKAIAFYPSKVKPSDDELRKAIDTALAAK
jgi:glutathione peroxidase